MSLHWLSRGALMPSQESLPPESAPIPYAPPSADATAHADRASLGSARPRRAGAGGWRVRDTPLPLKWRGFSRPVPGGTLRHRLGERHPRRGTRLTRPLCPSVGVLERVYRIFRPSTMGTNLAQAMQALTTAPEGARLARAEAQRFCHGLCHALAIRAGHICVSVLVRSMRRLASAGVTSR